MFGTTIATTTITAAVQAIGASTLDAVIYVVSYAWPWLLLAAAIAYLYRVVKSIWRAH